MNGYGYSVMPNIQLCLSIVKKAMRWEAEHCLQVSEENRILCLQSVSCRGKVCLQVGCTKPKSCLFYLFI
jgi:hypothetical protein